MRDLLREAGYACRLLMRQRGPVLLAFITLTLAIGICATVLSVSYAVLRGELPFTAPDRLIMLSQSNTSLGLSRFWISPANYLDLRDQNQVFTGLAAGICLGVCGEWAVGRSLSSLLYGVAPFDLIILVAVPLS